MQRPREGLCLPVRATRGQGWGGGLELVEKEYRGHIIWGLGGHNRESAFSLSETGTPGVLRAELGASSDILFLALLLLF